MPPDYSKLLYNLNDDQLERFVADWVSSKMAVYQGGHERFSGSGDMGRDVVGYCTPQRLDAAWHNYQCKQLKNPLGSTEFYRELAKIFFHSDSGAFPMPERMYFVAPRGVVRAVRAHVSKPSSIAPALVSAWQEICASHIEAGQTHLLSVQLREAITAHDFSTTEILDADKLVRFPEIRSILVKWFDDDPGDYPKFEVPDQLTDDEGGYVTELLAAYGNRTGSALANAADALAHPTHGHHLRDQRTRYFEASAFTRYYRDNTPPGTVDDFQQQIYHGVVDESRGTFKDALERIDKVLKHASTLQPAGRLGKYARIPVKQGTCHQLVNKGQLRWTE
jgi:hypothetical protein